MVEAEDDIINCFKVFDTDKSGKCDTDELIHALTTLGEMSKNDAEQLVEDAGGSGKSSFDYSKFVKKMNKKAKGGSEDEQRERDERERERERESVLQLPLLNESSP